MLVFLGHLSLIIIADEQYVNISELEICMHILVKLLRIQVTEVL